jgi:hypothetical protein
MRRVIKVLVLSATIALIWAPTPARADGYVSPFIGANFGNSSGDGRANFGVNAGYMGGGVIGGELDFGYAPSFFGNAGTFGSNYVTEVMGNLIVGVPVGGTHGPGVRPYVTVGAGLIRSQITGGVGNAIVKVSDNEAGLNAGAGLMGFISQHVGLRGDVRYFRNLSGNSTLNNIDFGSFHFWRASIGVVLR